MQFVDGLICWKMWVTATAVRILLPLLGENYNYITSNLTHPPFSEVPWNFHFIKFSQKCTSWALQMSKPHFRSPWPCRWGLGVETLTVDLMGGKVSQCQISALWLSTRWLGWVVGIYSNFIVDCLIKSPFKSPQARSPGKSVTGSIPGNGILFIFEPNILFYNRQKSFFLIFLVVLGTPAPQLKAFLGTLVLLLPQDNE